MFLPFTCLWSGGGTLRCLHSTLEMKQNVGQVPKMCRKLFRFLNSCLMGTNTEAMAVLPEAGVCWERGVEEKQAFPPSLGARNHTQFAVF